MYLRARHPRESSRNLRQIRAHYGKNFAIPWQMDSFMGERGNLIVEIVSKIILFEIHNVNMIFCLQSVLTYH